MNLIDYTRIYPLRPEVSFRLLSDGTRIQHSKKTWGSLHARLALLESDSIDLPVHIDEVNHVGVDDVEEPAEPAASRRLRSTRRRGRR